MGLRTLFVISMLWMSTTRAEEITFETDVSIKRNNELNFTTVPAGQKLVMTRGEFVYVVTPNNPPLLMFSASNNKSQLLVKESNFTAALKEVLRPQIESVTNEILSALRRADQLLQKRDYSRAAQLVAPLKEKYPRVSSILFMDGTIHYLLNDKSLAIESLEKGLALDPNNEDAQHLLARLRGSSHD
jgi:Tfp pilus assembly protein PilF